MLLKSCGKCGKPVPYPQKYCDRCKPQAEAEEEVSKKASNKKYNKKRSNDMYSKFYKSKAWERLSRAYMASKEYKCERCGAIATEVHHKSPIQTARGWLLRLVWENLEALCIKCHNKEHKRFGG